MEELKSLLHVCLKEHHGATGRTSHSVDGCLITRVAELRVSGYGDSPGYYLLYFDDAGEEITDTFHETVEGAIDQAQFEFNVRPDEWEPGG